MAAPRACCVHIILEEKGALIPITERTLSTIKACAKQWKHLGGLQRSTAKKFISDLEDSVSFGTLGYHALCFRRFTDKTRIERAVKRCAQQRKTKPEALCTETQPRRSSRSTNSGVEKGEQRKNSYVLPEQCIICKGIKYIKNPHIKSRRREQLSLCEFSSGRFLIRSFK